MAQFATAFAFTLKNEGGYVFTNSKNDKGKMTYAGLTAKTVERYLGMPVTEAIMRNLTATQVQDVYRAYYWNDVMGDKQAQQIVAMALFDMSVLMGAPSAMPLAQSVCGVAADGVCGPKTLAAMAKVGVVAFVNQFSDLCDQYFARIVARDPTQAQWLAGWQKRTSLMDHLTEI